MEDHVYLKETLGNLSIVGIGRLKTRKPLPNLLHQIYSKLMLTIFGVFLATQFAEIFFLEDHQELMENLALTLLYLVTFGKILVSKSEKLKNLVGVIWNFEQELFAGPEETSRNIYMDHVMFFRKINLFLIAVGLVTTVPFFIRPIVEDQLYPQVPPYDVINNTTVVYKPRPLPLSSWFPFDKYKYYYTSYVLQVIPVTYAATSLVCTDSFLLGLMVFITGRIRIFQETLRNLENPKKLVRKFVIEHTNIIRFVKELDNAMTHLMLLDFGICSVQIAITAFWVIVTPASIQLAVGLIYFSAMLIQLFLFYWFANMVIFESTEISSAIWNSNWYEYDKSIKRSLLLIMLKAQKPLTLSVGPFYVMSNPTAVMILKAAYSYVALLFKVYYAQGK